MTDEFDPEGTLLATDDGDVLRHFFAAFVSALETTEDNEERQMLIKPLLKDLEELSEEGRAWLPEILTAMSFGASLFLHRRAGLADPDPSVADLIAADIQGETLWLKK